MITSKLKVTVLRISLSHANCIRSCNRKSIAISLCGGLENDGPNEEDFEKHMIQYSEVIFTII